MSSVAIPDGFVSTNKVYRLRGFGCNLNGTLRGVRITEVVLYANEATGKTGAVFTQSVNGEVESYWFDPDRISYIGGAEKIVSINVVEVDVFGFPVQLLEIHQ